MAAVLEGIDPAPRPAAGPVLPAGFATRLKILVHFSCSIDDLSSHRRPFVRIDGMTTSMPTAHSPTISSPPTGLIRELLATLRQQTHLNESLQHQLEQTPPPALRQEVREARPRPGP